MGLLNGLFLILLFSSCAKLSYITEQGLGQASLEYNDIDVNDFLADEKQTLEHKRKVQLILTAKKYFYSYFKMEQGGIYDEVKILDQEAVTYLVIYSPKDKVEAIQTWFPVLGNFPYLGFFSKESAIRFQDEKRDLGFATYRRAVYAYSTLNHPLMPFDDNILSSFFYYQDEDLIELIFHELTHTIIFVRDNISFNENLANFVAEKMRMEYLNLSQKEQNSFSSKRVKEKKISKFIIQKVKELNELYTFSLKGIDKSKRDRESEKILKVFLEQNFTPKLKNFCEELGVINCWPLQSEWNNARFAALGTYSDKQERLEKMYKISGLSLKDFVKKVIKIKKEFNEEVDFLSYLEQKL